MPHADVEVAVRECVEGALVYNGQRDTSIKILFVHRMILDRFVPQFVAAVNHLHFGMPWDVTDMKNTAITFMAKKGYLTCFRVLTNKQDTLISSVL